MASPFSLRLFVPSGQPDGIRVVEKSNWSGIGFVVPRSQLNEFIQRDEATRPGVYVLLGPDPQGGQDLVYIGEADPLERRLRQHQQREFWTIAFAFTSMNRWINKAHVQHLEARLIDIARQAKRCNLQSNQAGKSISLSDADKAEAEGFLAEFLLCCPVLGLRVFEKPVANDPMRVRHLYHLQGPDASGTGYESPGGFTVLAGALARKDFVESASQGLRAARSQLLDRGLFADCGGCYELKQDYEFSSPTQASNLLLARHGNGRIDWKDSDGRTLKENQDRVAEEAIGDSDLP